MFREGIGGRDVDVGLSGDELAQSTYQASFQLSQRNKAPHNRSSSYILTGSQTPVGRCPAFVPEAVPMAARSTDRPRPEIVWTPPAGRLNIRER